MGRSCLTIGLFIKAILPMRILIAEDDVALASFVKKGLEAEHYTVSVVHTGEEGFYVAHEQAFDLIILDVMLPGRDGLEVLATLRRRGNTTPVLLLTAKDAIDDRVRGLRAGGDDYLTKPFSFVELLARVEALARRSDTVIKETVLRVGDLELDLVSRTVSRRGRDINLLPREFQLLEYLVRNAGRVVSRTMLLQHVWDLHFDPTTNIIDVYVGRVRRKVDGPQTYPLIHTIRGVGFCVRAPR